jgi:hypothetical protein
MPGPESTSPIYLDESPALIVIKCTEHDWYNSCRFHRDEAYDAACAHEAAEHAGDVRHRDARAKRKREALAKSRRVAAANQALSSVAGGSV